MTFSEAYEQSTPGPLAIENAADILGLYDRTAWAWEARYNDERPEGPEWRLGSVLDHSVPVDAIMQTLEL